MHKMTGIILIISGFLLFITGLFIYFSPNNNQNIDKEVDIKNIVELAITKRELAVNEKVINSNPEIQKIDDNKKQGDDFEKFVVQKFSKQYFKIKEWAGDKYVDGFYAETTIQPDILLEFNINKTSHLFSVECKWRREKKINGVTIASKAQLKRYTEFQETNKIPVFIVLGIGGTGKAPEQLFIIPLNDVQAEFINNKKLTEYKRKVDSNFFYDYKNKKLR